MSSANLNTTDETERNFVELSHQSALPFSDHAILALAGFAEDTASTRGAIYTRREVVEFILDLVGYTADKPLHQSRLLEPSFGEGSFLLPAIERLIAAWNKNFAGQAPALAQLADCIRAIELHRPAYETTKEKVILLLQQHGISYDSATELADQWLVCGDYLLTPLERRFDFVVGNPPYVRQELIPDALLAEYRSRYRTIYDRADLYIPFIERSLTLLAKQGQLSFICADRWMKNRYGGPLRKMIAVAFHLKFYIDMVGTAAFESEVTAYPAITVIIRKKSSVTRVSHRPELSADALSRLSSMLLAENLPAQNVLVKEINGVVDGEEPWILESSDQLALVRRLEALFPAIEEAGCKIGIGVATGADKAFIGPYDELDVESDRKLPLVMTRDIESGSVHWRKQGVINPFAEDGTLVDLAQYPRLRQYLEERKEVIARRHCAAKAPQNWYRTIDRIWPALAKRPKLLIPDIKGTAHVVYEDGFLYPHHNLYYITSDTWDLRALQAVLLSGIARLFVSVYSTKMRGGYMRFQAQYLRRIRIPRWEAVPATVRDALINAAVAQDMTACNRAVFMLYEMTEEERTALGGNGDAI